MILIHLNKNPRRKIKLDKERSDLFLMCLKKV